MNWILLFSCSVLLCCIPTEGLKCRVCKLLRGCAEGDPETCEAIQGQQCVTEKVFKEGVRNFVTRGCTLPNDPCGTTKEDRDWGTVTRVCCDDRDFCNE